MKRHVISHLLCILIGGIIFSSVAYASNIYVHFLPLKYFINGESKAPLRGQEGFIFNGRTYVPLRFIAESLSCDVVWEGATSSIYLTSTASNEDTDEVSQQKVYFTGTWKTDSGSIYNLKQNGTSVTGTLTHYADESKYEFPVTGIVNDKNIQLTWIYNNAEVYAIIKNVPLRVARQVLGISETAMLTLDPETNILEGSYYQDYVEWDSDTFNVLKKSDGNSLEALNKMAPLKIKLSGKKL